MKTQNYEKSIHRLALLWDNQVMDRCCVSVLAPKDPSKPYVENIPTTEADLKHWYNDGEWILKRNLARIDATYYAGDALPMIFPYFGTGGHAKYIAPQSVIEYAPDTIWVHPCIDDLATYSYDFDSKTNPILQQEKAILTYLASEANGRYFVAMPDNCGSYDALAQLRGNEKLMMDFIMQPDEVKFAAKQLTEILKSASEELFAAVKENCFGGSVHGWMHTYSPKRHLQLQCDLSVMISNDTFKEFIVDEIQNTAQWLDHAVYHLDGMEQIRHLDDLLAIDSLNMIQWTQVAGQPPATEFLPVLKKIQAANKGLVLLASKKQLPILLKNLSPKGLNLVVTDAASPEEAEEIVTYISRF